MAEQEIIKLRNSLTQSEVANQAKQRDIEFITNGRNRLNEETKRLQATVLQKDIDIDNLQREKSKVTTQHNQTLDELTGVKQALDKSQRDLKEHIILDIKRHENEKQIKDIERKGKEVKEGQDYVRSETQRLLKLKEELENRKKEHEKEISIFQEYIDREQSDLNVSSRSHLAEMERMSMEFTSQATQISILQKDLQKARETIRNRSHNTNMEQTKIANLTDQKTRAEMERDNAYIQKNIILAVCFFIFIGQFIAFRR